MGIILNETFINKTAFRMVLLSVIDVKYFNLKNAISFVFAFSKALAKLGMAKLNLSSYFV